jgi:hypothetical protein
MAEKEDTRRFGLPYIVPTWISGIISGDKKCRFAPWYKAHFRYRKLTRDGNLDQWKAEHSEMVDARVNALRAAGHKVSVEDQNAFKLVGVSAIVAGTPDIVIQFESGSERVEDCKSGKRRASDYWQVVIYAVVKALIDRTLAGRISGGLIYKDGDQDITIEKIAEGKRLVLDTIKAVASEDRPVPEPSVQECKYCDIAACAVRASAPAVAEASTEEF